MFQVALALACRAKNGGRTKLSLNYFEDHPCHNGWEIESVFEFKAALAVMPYDEAQQHEDEALRLSTMSDDTADMRFSDDVFSHENNFYRGYYQSYKYFSEYEQLIRDNFRFKAEVDLSYDLLHQIKSGNSVSVHVRRGDYLSDENFKYFGGICSELYYQRCIELISSKVANAKFFIFTNDADWCRKEFGGNRFTVVEGNVGLDSWKDMYLMSLCKHCVIANSSFSWWGMWLGERSNSIVCGPSRFFNEQLAEHSIRDLLPDYVTCVDEKGKVVKHG
jgi:hypothetical protein